MVQTTIATPTPDEIGGAMEATWSCPAHPRRRPTRRRATAPVELGYFTLGFTDTAMASRFYRELFGWQTEQGNVGAEYAHVVQHPAPARLHA